MGAPPMQHTRHGHALVALGGMLYACGGWSADDRTMDNVERFNPKLTQKGRWETLRPMLRNRGHAVAGALARKLVICGGYATCNGDVGDCLDCTELYDPAKGIWEPGPRMLEQRSCAAEFHGDARSRVWILECVTIHDIDAETACHGNCSWLHLCGWWDTCDWSDNRSS